MLYNNHWQEKCCLFVITQTHRHECAITVPIHARLNSHDKHLHSAKIHLCSQVTFLDHFSKTAYVCVCSSQSEWGMWVNAIFPYVCVAVHACICVCVRVWLCGCAAIIITLVNTHMSTYWSVNRWAMKDLRLQRALWICLDFYWDHTVRSAQVQLKITSRARLLALRQFYGRHWIHIWLEHFK